MRDKHMLVAIARGTALTVFFISSFLIVSTADNAMGSSGGSLPADYDCSQEAGYGTNEDAFGPGNVTGVSGNGGLTAGFGYAGELTVLRWPSPSYYEQVCYLTPLLSNACEARKQPHNGALDTMGSFAGIYFQAADGRSEMTWFRDPSWKHTQYYNSSESNVFITLSENPSLGITVEALNFVYPEEDILVRHYKISRDPRSPIKSLRVFYYENMEVVTTKIPFLPIADTVLEGLFDFSALYYSADDAIVHFRPQAPVKSMIPAADAPQTEIDQIVEHLDTIFPYNPALPDTPEYLAIGADYSGLGGSTLSDGHQCGQQLLQQPWWGKLQGAYYNSLEGRLNGSSAAVGRVDSAIMKEVSSDLPTLSFTIYITASSQAGEALRLLAGAKERGWESLFLVTEQEWSGWLRNAKMPRTTDPDILALCKRSLITLRQGWDKKTGAFVASVASQPPYSVSWPRDQSFLAHAMDVAGYTDIAEKAHEFQATVQRNCEDPTSQQYDIFCKDEGMYHKLFGWNMDGTYNMSYFADGVPGGLLFFEIDNSGFAVWSMWDHYTFLDKVSGNKYLCGVSGDPAFPGVYQAIKKTTTSLADCRTPHDESGLQCHAFEDDNMSLTQTLTGAITVFLAIDSAIKAGNVCGEDPAQITAWMEREEELRKAIDSHFWNEAGGYYDDNGSGPAAYMLWPARFPIAQDRFDSNARNLFSRVKASLAKETVSNAYIGKYILGLATAGWDTGDPTYNLKWALDVLTKEVPEHDTLQYGEVFQTVDINSDGKKEFSNRVALPHLWEASLSYLSAMAYYGPSEGPPTPPITQETGNCGCSSIPLHGTGSLGIREIGLNLLLVILPCVKLFMWKRAVLRALQ